MAVLEAFLARMCLQSRDQRTAFIRGKPFDIDRPSPDIERGQSGMRVTPRDRMEDIRPVALLGFRQWRFVG